MALSIEDLEKIQALFTAELTKMDLRFESVEIQMGDLGSRFKKMEQELDQIQGLRAGFDVVNSLRGKRVGSAVGLDNFGRSTDADVFELSTYRDIVGR